MTQRQVDLLWSVAFLVLASWIFLTARRLSGGAGLFPEVAACLMGAGAAGTLLLRLLGRGGAGEPFAGVQWLRLGTVVACFAATLAAMGTVGFPLASFTMFTVCALTVQESRITVRGGIATLLLAAVVVAVLTAIFVVLLGVRLPLGPFG